MFLKLRSVFKPNYTANLNLDIYEIVNVYTKGNICFVRVRSKGVIGYNYVTYHNILLTKELREFLEDRDIGDEECQG